MADIDNQGTPRKGRIGPNTYYMRNGQLIARVATNMRSPTRKGRTPQNMASRTRIANVIHAWKSFQGELKGLFEPQKAGQTDYNVFMSVNRTNARVCLSKQEVKNQYCVADNFCVSMGQLTPPVQVREEEGWMVSDLACGELEINAQTLVSDVGYALCKHNPLLLRQGDEVVFVSLRQYVDINTHAPMCDPRVARLPIRGYSETTMIELLRYQELVDCFCNHGGFLATPRRSDTLVAWVRVRPVEKHHPMVTTQSLVGTPPLIEEYTSEKHIEEAITSYGPLK